MGILSDKEQKKAFKKVASAEPEKYYATSVLKEEGFVRKKCERNGCGTYFWTVNEDQKFCGDADCSGGFRLFQNNPCKRAMTYTETWREFAKMFEKLGYTVMNRYPVVARWNPTMEYTIASIAAFQPYVVSGEVVPPAKKLVIPQFCLRFGDVDNVGVTMSHMTGFVMIGQHAFVPPKDWDQERAFRDILKWLTDGLGLPKEEITFHEDAWAGGGNFGPCMEYFSRGVELGNQVYMLFEQTPDSPKELGLKVLDMGMGHERNAWFSQGKGTIYDATFPYVVEKLKKATAVTYDEEFMKRYIPHAAYLNLDEVEDIGAAWMKVADAVGASVDELREKIEPMTAIYSIAEHARSLLVALADGALPSNAGGGYNLRALFRRAQGFIERFGWADKIDMGEVAAWHAEELKELFPELFANLDDVKKILAVELRKHRETTKRAQQVLANEVKKWDAAMIRKDPEGMIEKLINLYDSHGIQPAMVARVLKEEHDVELKVPERFYQLVAERHEQAEQKTATRREHYYELDDVPKTKVLYFGAHDAVVFTGNVIKVIDGTHVVLDQTAFYPTSGGQEHDTGTLNGEKVIDVIKQDGVILHVLEKRTKMKVGDVATGQIDLDRRHQLSQHHTVAHIINGAARRVLGNHVWQAGAAKTVEKGRLDITHYDALSDDQLREIEEEANKIVAEGIAISRELVKKDVAEREHGFRLYQGGAVPGAEIRVVDIPGFDVEACGGTHLDNTKDAGTIKILRSTKVQDGVVRIEYVAGKAAESLVAAEEEVLDTIAAALGCEHDQIPGRCSELFAKWKKARKNKLTPEQVAAPLTSVERWPGDILSRAAEVMRTQPEHVLKTIERFKKDIEAKR